MDYYSNSRGGRSSYRGSSSSYRGSRGAPRGSRGFAPRGTRGGSSASYKPYDTAQSSRYPSSYEGSKYGASSAYPSSHRSGEDYYSRRSESFGTRERDHRSELSDLASRKRERNDSYSQGVSRRGHEEEYRSGSGSGSGRYGPSSGGGDPSPSSRSYDDSRAFKKPRNEFKTDYKSEHRVKEPLAIRARPAVPRGTFRGSFAPRRAAFSSYRGRGGGGASFGLRSNATGRANTSEILAIRRAKLLQKRQKEQGSANGTDVKIKTEKLEDEEDTTGAEAADAPVLSERGKHLMKLECPACTVKCITFREYTTHLHQAIHEKAMQDKTEQLRATLASMRLKQRELQKQMDANDIESLSLDTASHFCAVCKLNYSQDVDKHENSDMHKQLRDILLPECGVCRIPFRSLVQYEHHLCSLSHLKQKNLKEMREKRSLPASGVLDKFITLDSVGSGDEVEESEESKEKEEGTGGAGVGGGTAGEEADAEAANLTLGAEFIHEILAQYCEVCRKFLRVRRDKTLSIKNHCCTKEHLRAYLHYGTDELLDKIKNADNKEKAGGESEEPLDESKLWDGLSEILDDGQATHKSDDEEEEEGGRFDRINSKEKNENGEAAREELNPIEDVVSGSSDTGAASQPALVDSPSI